MPIDYRLPALRRRRQAIAVKVSNQQEIIDAARLDDRSATVFAMQIQDAQLEFDELEFVICFFEDYDFTEHDPDRTRVQINYYAIIAAILLWFIVTFGFVLLTRWLWT